MLTFTRKPGESILFSLAPDIDPATPIGEVLAGTFRVKVDKTTAGNVIISIDAPKEIKVMRNELVE